MIVGFSLYVDRALTNVFVAELSSVFLNNNVMTVTRLSVIKTRLANCVKCGLIKLTQSMFQNFMMCYWVFRLLCQRFLEVKHTQKTKI